MKKKISLLFTTLVFLFLFSLSSLAQDTYSYGFNFDVKGYDVMPITHACPTVDPMDEECVAVGTIYPNALATDKKNGIHFIRFNKHGNLLASVYFNHTNADERAIKIIHLNNTCDFLIVSLVREYTILTQDVIKITRVDINGNFISEYTIQATMTYANLKHLYPMDAKLINDNLYIVGSISADAYNSNPLQSNGLNFSNPNLAFVCKFDINNPTINDIKYFGNAFTPLNLNGTNSYYNLARSIKQTDDGRVFIMGMTNYWQGYPNSLIPSNIYPAAMIAELDLTNLSLINYAIYENNVGANVGTIATDLYYDPNSNNINLLVNELKIDVQTNAGIQNTTLLPWAAFWVYKLDKSFLTHSGSNKFQPFDNLYATNFVEQSNGDLKIVGWQFTSDVSHTSMFTISRDCPFIQNVTIDNHYSNFMIPTTLNTLVEGTLNTTSPYQYLGGSNLSTIWQLPRIGSLSGLYDNLILTGTHLLNAPKFGLKCIYTDNFGSSCGLQEMHYSSSYVSSSILNTNNFYYFYPDSYIRTNLKTNYDNFPFVFMASCVNDNLFKKGKSLDSIDQVLIYPNKIKPCEGFHITSLNRTNSSSQISIKIFTSLGQQIYSSICIFSKDVFVDPLLLNQGVYFVEVRIDDKIYKERIEVF